MESDLENNCSSDLSPNTVLPHRHRPNIEKRSTNSKLTCRDDILRVKDGFTEISFCRYRSASCKNVPPRPSGLEGNIELRQGSVYQTSREVRKMKKMGSNEGRRKIELSSRGSDSSLSFQIVESLCSSDEESAPKIYPAMSVKSNSNSTSVQKPCTEPYLASGFIEIHPDLGNREKPSAGVAASDSYENPNFRSEQVFRPLDDGNDPLEGDKSLAFRKSDFAKVEMPPSPSPSESNSSRRASSKSRFNAIRKMFDPFVKSKSVRSPLGCVAEPGDFRANIMETVGRNQTLQKSLLHDFSHTAQKSDCDTQPVKKDVHNLAVASSPVHLHGSLKLETENGVPFFEFFLNCPEEVLVAKTWKANNAFNWVYTFHSICSRKKGNASGWSLNNGNKEISMVGQMQVSCYLSSELKDGGVFDNSMMTEFVLYDIAHTRPRIFTKDLPELVKPPNDSSPGAVGRTRDLDDGSDAMKPSCQPKHAFYNGKFGPSNPYPWQPAVLHPELEVAAIVIQLPFAKRESLKCKRGEKICHKSHLNLLNFPMVYPRKKDLPHMESPEKVKVVIPTGNHSLPSGESHGPSSLLDRWRSGGGCDCGGWDMACPLTVFGNPRIQCFEDQPLMDNQQPFELFVQGTKEKMPALTMTIVEEGTYAVDFHAQLSSLQAFSICVAILHGMEASNATGEETSKQLPHCNSLKLLIEEEVKFLIDAVTEEENKKALKKTEEIQKSYVLNPPFSPFARV